MKEDVARGFILGFAIVILLCFFIPIGAALFWLYKYNIFLGMFATGLIGVTVMAEVIKS